ncbi:metabolite traffic protein EboE [Parapedobacter sp. DT-150]|uniref:metabolite traffic protein EboE n=1 Tax=Parapedobacter sp. DT-150 TaxID=3396162 RepID=UPI003F1AE976
MLTVFGHLTYCTNIHGGETWDDHFKLLKSHFPQVKKTTAPNHPTGLGLRLSDLASRSLTAERNLAELKDWLAEVDAYVFTMNGFPFGAFHDAVVKARVHAPDWTTAERLDYTKRMFDVLARLLPERMEGGISTSPLAYRHGYNATQQQWATMRAHATRQIIAVAGHLVQLQREQGKALHLDIEPEPDGVLESGAEFIAWYEGELVPAGIAVLSKQFGMTASEAEQALKHHIRLCYDVCHFALGYEQHDRVVEALARQDIQIGKFQISAAIKAAMPSDRAARQLLGEAFMAFDEPTYLHQVIARQRNGSLVRFKDLPDAQSRLFDEQATEWRSHFHVPIFLEDLGVLKSTQSDIKQVLDLQRERQLTPHLEVETYTWAVLPEHLQLPIADSISRELNWVLDQLNEQR